MANVFWKKKQKTEPHQLSHIEGYILPLYKHRMLSSSSNLADKIIQIALGIDYALKGIRCQDYHTLYEFQEVLCWSLLHMYFGEKSIYSA